MFGWRAKLLRVDHTTDRITTESVDAEVLLRCIGGKGLATHYLYDEVPPHADPLGAENRLYLAAGPAQATRIPITGRCAPVQKVSATDN